MAENGGRSHRPLRTVSLDRVDRNKSSSYQGIQDSGAFADGLLCVCLDDDGFMQMSNRANGWREKARWRFDQLTTAEASTAMRYPFRHSRYPRGTGRISILMTRQASDSHARLALVRCFVL